MIPSLLLVAASAFGSLETARLDTRLAAGLAVTIDSIPEPMTVDGVSMTVERVTGRGVPELARRIEAAWHGQGSKVESRQQESWIVRSRIQGSRSEVLQWRAGTGDPELLLSSLDVRAPVRSSSSAGLKLPAGCTWGRSISGRAGNQSYLQRSARCSHTRKSLSLQLGHLLPTQGWKVVAETDSGLLVERAGSEGFISLSVHEGESATWLTWVRTGASQ